MKSVLVALFLFVASLSYAQLAPKGSDWVGSVYVGYGVQILEGENSSTPYSASGSFNVNREFGSWQVGALAYTYQDSTGIPEFLAGVEVSNRILTFAQNQSLRLGARYLHGVYGNPWYGANVRYETPDFGLSASGYLGIDNNNDRNVWRLEAGIHMPVNF